MNCTDCKYLEIVNYNLPGDALCHRFPKHMLIDHPDKDWCGEWKPKATAIDPVVIKLPARRTKKVGKK